VREPAERALAVSAFALVGAVGLAVLVVALWEGNASAVERTIVLLAPIGLVWLALTHLASRARRTGTLRIQYAVGVAGTVAIALAAILWVARQMFVSHHDAGVLLAVVGFAAVVGTRTALVLAGRAQRDVEQVRAGLDAFAVGDLSHRIEPSGPAEVQALARSANAMAERLARARSERDAADRARRNLVAAVSHDLRTPLTSLRLLVEAIQDGVVAEPTEVRASLQAMGVHVHALSALVDDLFELARLDAGDISWSLSRVAVAELLDETAEAFRPEAARRGLRLEATSDPSLGVTGNPERLQRVLFNLVQNAVRHTPADGTVSLRAGPEDGQVVIEVADSGQGIAPGDAEQAFERFWRGGSEAARPQGGAGLGLAISRAIVEAHGGRIWIEPGAAPGTRVRFSLPAAG
jgi:signal transduction histidine kinase